MQSSTFVSRDEHRYIIEAANQDKAPLWGPRWASLHHRSNESRQTSTSGGGGNAKRWRRGITSNSNFPWSNTACCVRQLRFAIREGVAKLIQHYYYFFRITIQQYNLSTIANIYFSCRIFYPHFRIIGHEYPSYATNSLHMHANLQKMFTICSHFFWKLL